MLCTFWLIALAYSSLLYFVVLTGIMHELFCRRWGLVVCADAVSLAAVGGSLCKTFIFYFFSFFADCAIWACVWGIVWIWSYFGHFTPFPNLCLLRKFRSWRTLIFDLSHLGECWIMIFGKFDVLKSLFVTLTC